MNELTRRGFLSGMATAVAGGLIIEASDNDVKRFAGVGQAVSVLSEEKPFIHSGEVSYGRLHISQRLYNEHGDVVGVVVDVALEQQAYDITTASDSQKRFLLGRTRTIATVLSV